MDLAPAESRETSAGTAIPAKGQLGELAQAGVSTAFTMRSGPERSPQEFLGALQEFLGALQEFMGGLHEVIGGAQPRAETASVAPLPPRRRVRFETCARTRCAQAGRELIAVLHEPPEFAKRVGRFHGRPDSQVCVLIREVLVARQARQVRVAPVG